ncbi:MAG TPA: S49 family peptidase, partial [Saprospiraceae bacterium]|nr:S49 family peptidase [Saprospiraceae bacterium]
MKQFFKYVLASCIGIFLFLFVLLLIGGGVGLAGMIKSKFDKGFKKESILVMDFKTNLPEKTNNVERPPFTFNDNNVVGVHAVLDILEHAAENDKIKGLYIKTNSMPTAFYSNARLLRQGIQEFKESGKFVYAYGDYFTQGGYYLASAADSIFLNPIGGIDLRGLGAELLYFKDMLDKIGVEPKVFYAGKFKSATEPFRRNDMSEENRTQTRAFLEDVQERLITDIAESRNLTRDRVLEIMNNYESRRAYLALDAGLIDAAWQKEELLETLKSRMAVDEYDDIDYIDFNDYYNKMDRDDDDSDDEIAVVIAEGSIVDNSDENGVID